jgi:membrane-bound lytic murein transglycosylase B/uncharacterized protein YoxC
MKVKAKSGKNIFIVAVFSIALVFAPFFSTRATNQDQIDALNQQIQQIQTQIDAYQQQIDANSGKAKTLSADISQLNTRISQLQLEIKSLGLSIDQTAAEIAATLSQIDIANKQLSIQKAALASYIQILNQDDRENLATILLKNDSLSGFFDSLKGVQDIQNKAGASIVTIKGLENDLESNEADLEGKKSDLEDMRSIQVAQNKSLSSDKSYEDQLLKTTKGEEARYQKLVTDSQTQINAIKQQIYYLQQNGVTAEEAIQYGEEAANRVGIRPAFLIGILEVESGLGKNVGTGNWEDDMYNCFKKLGKVSQAEAQKEALLQIVAQLGLNIDTVKVSAEPNYGCGGALGPAQFLPTTWLGYEDQVAQISGHNPPNPWNIEDAFIAAAAKLFNAGAAARTTAAETAAAKTYFSGKSNCATAACNSYARAVLNKAAAIEPNL